MEDSTQLHQNIEPWTTCAHEASSNVVRIYTEFHLVLLQWRWRSPTDAILECRADMYTAVVGMRFPNVDDKTWHDDKWRTIGEQQYDIHHRRRKVGPQYRREDLNCQIHDKVYVMVSDDRDYIGVGFHLKFLPFFQVLHQEGNGENNQQNVIAYDGDGSIYRWHGSDVEKVVQYLMFGGIIISCIEIAEGRLHKTHPPLYRARRQV
ncbi:uncharacterized protein F5147DRAFT_706441 [Suillus discolor]|uniref:Uncharacterized protein n=1 Tax=Suillus discolor TaxID=1912936 RepID=A0A9P7F1E2_9AGAM|nr:uncharacterized protein F5147DRAFT_706441 [Suillus discolor]KAG2103072.1 hypothetical protein F5147DRAFT_706441 [Suillus discolor]